MPSTFQPTQFGRFLLVDRIAVGGMAEIFHAKVRGALGFEKSMVIKRILPQYANDAEFLRMFVTEAKLVCHLEHPNIIQVHELGEQNGQYYIAMETVNGIDARELWRTLARRKQRLPGILSLYIVSEFLKGLDYAHRAVGPDGRMLGVVHRDISPSNVLISFRGDVKVGDFGIALVEHESRTQAGVLKGKYGYMAPEQVAGLKVDHRTDIFSAGTVLTELLLGRRLFLGRNDFETLDKVLNVRLDVLNDNEQTLPGDVVAILHRALQREPHDRYQSAREFHDAIVELLFAQGKRISNETLAAFMAQHVTPYLGQPVPDTSSASASDAAVAPAPTATPAQAAPPTTEEEMPGAPAASPPAAPAAADDPAARDERPPGPRQAAPFADLERSEESVEQLVFMRIEEDEDDAPDDAPWPAASRRARAPGLPGTGEPQPAGEITLEEAVSEAEGESAGGSMKYPVAPRRRTTGRVGSWREDISSSAVPVSSGTPIPPAEGQPPGEELDPQALSSVSPEQMEGLQGVSTGELFLEEFSETPSRLIGLQKRPSVLVNQVLAEAVSSRAGQLPDFRGELHHRSMTKVLFRFFVVSENGLLSLSGPQPGGEKAELLAWLTALRAKHGWRDRGPQRPALRTCEIHFLQGNPHLASADRDDEVLVTYLIHAGVLTREQVTRAVEDFPDRSLVPALLNCDYLAPLQVSRHITAFVLDSVLETFAWREGTFAFFRDRACSTEAFPTGLDGMGLILKGISSLQASLLDPYLDGIAARTLVPNRTPPMWIGAFKPDRDLALVYRMLGETRPVSDALLRCIEQGGDPRKVKQALYLLVECDMALLT